MKAILLGKYCDVTDFASKDKSRYAIQSVHYLAGRKLIEAVDGRIMIRVPVIESDDFPTVKGQCETQPIDCIIPCQAIKKGLGNIPPSKIPALEHARLDANGQITLTTTDLDTEQSVTAKPIDATYPNLDQVEPRGDTVATIAIGAAYLKKIADYALKHADGGEQAVTISIKDDMSPLRFSMPVKTLNGTVKVTGCVMPVRLS